MTTTPCVSLTTGTLRPDERVNYAYGMVLGLDEFLAEQLYLLSKDRLHDRGLHGFGTVSGLDVSVSQVDSDFQVMVSTGIGIDQWGREIVITCDQCARLGAWVAAQEQQSPGTLAQHLDATGQATVYVVASYAECLDDMVPLPGQPCSSSDQTMVASRIRDAWDVELRWDDPAMPRWDTDRRLARLLGNVVVVDGLPAAQSDEAAIVAAVLDLANRVHDGPDSLDPPATSWQLPAEDASAAFDRILAAWVTQVRPGIVPDLATPEATSEPAILLATVTFTPASPFDPAAPTIASCQDPDSSGRPYLLHTELIQEVRTTATGGGGAPVVSQAPPVQLVTLAGTGTSSGATIEAWFHLAQPVRLPATIDVTDETGTTTAYAAVAESPDANGFSSVWQLTSPGGPGPASGSQVVARFPAASVLVGDPASSLLQIESSLSFLDQETGGDVLAYAEIAAAAPATVPNVEFVSIEPVLSNVDQVILELWFHLMPHGVADKVFTVRPVVSVFDETTGALLPSVLSGPAPWERNVWRLAVVSSVQGQGPRQYLRLVFATKDFAVDVGGTQMPLAEWIDRSGLTYVGWDPGAADIVVFDFAPLAGQLKPSFGGPFHNQLTPHALLGSAASTAKKTAAKKTVAKATAAKKTTGQEDDGEEDDGEEDDGEEDDGEEDDGEEDDGEEGDGEEETAKKVGASDQPARRLRLHRWSPVAQLRQRPAPRRRGPRDRPGDPPDPRPVDRSGGGCGHRARSVGHRLGYDTHGRPWAGCLCGW